ncbi:superfamily II DNA or RNA helicase [Rhodobacter viridis]|uniref:Superfamily II DNA or RNA helicase n=2 Tax=Rhodobacter viridis TaxID=1054202 RepID=A0A318U0A1_9RHOB|nr:superfamily II DNA or RNA helicase [Rhodobacter viridis]
MSAGRTTEANDPGAKACPICDAPMRLVVTCDAQCMVIRNGAGLLLAPRGHVARWRDLSPGDQAALAAQIGATQDLLAPGDAVVPVTLIEGETHVHFRLDPPSRARPDPLPGLPHDRALISGSDDTLHAHLRPLIDQSTAVDLSVSFLMTSGVRLVLPHLQDLLARGGRLRVLTGDYLDVTEPAALRLLTDLTGARHLFVFRASRVPFHPKAWLFTFKDGSGALIVGSSNLSKSALTDGVEWNLRQFDSHDTAPLAAARAGFEALLARPEVTDLTPDWIDAYEARRIAPRPDQSGAAEEPAEPPPNPHEVQREALAALRATRDKGYGAGLVVLATGLGKTYLAAFDSLDARRVLFVAHREEILTQAMAAFRAVRPQARMGRYSGDERDPEAEILFASVQTLARSAHLSRFDPQAFDYIVIDEFHHAAAATYRRLLAHFTPRFLLGLTATPDRSDGGDLLGLCEENLVYECDLWSGIDRKLLAPFHYFGVPDPVEYAQIPWRSGRFDEAALTEALATRARAENALDQLARRGGSRTIGFCVSRRHADFMAAFATERGLRAVAVHSGDSSAPRASALEALAAGALDIVFAVDMFNEGVDVPAIDTVLMLRPTESPVIWLQQLGRGLRRATGKTHLAVIDYIGNHRIFLTKLRTLLRAGPGDGALRLSLERFTDQLTAFPAGCEVIYDLEALDILRALIRAPRDGEELIAFYRDFRDRHGARPTASEVAHAGFNPARTGAQGWLGLVAEMGDLSAAEQAVWRAHQALFDEIETTRMTRSYKMLVLRALLEAGALPGRISLADLTARVSRMALRNPQIRADLSVAPEDEAALRGLLLAQPLKILGETPWFRLGPGVFETTFETASETAFGDLASELVDWRLHRYFQSRDMTYDLPETASLAEAAEEGSAAPWSPARTPSLWQDYPREAIAPLFGAVFNTGAWNAGIVTLKEARAMVLLVTLDKGSLSVGGHYTDHFVSPTRFVWQSQTSTLRDSLRGRILSGEEPGWSVHLFLRKSKLRDGRGAPFRYAGPVRFAGWDGETPITVQWDLSEPVPVSLRPLYGLADQT